MLSFSATHNPFIPILIGKHHIYGSSRLGLWRNQTKKTSTFTAQTTVNSEGETVLTSIASFTLHNYTADHITNKKGSRKAGDKRYEVTNHLGNVMAVITDRKFGVDDTKYDFVAPPFAGVYDYTTGNEYTYTGNGGYIATAAINNDLISDYYNPEVVSYSNYYPGGMLMPGRNGGSTDYKFAHQGQLFDKEITNGQDIYAYEYRMSDARLVRFWSIDPLSAKYPYNSTYAFSENRLIDKIELEGLETAEYSIHGATGVQVDDGPQVGIGIAGKGTYNTETGEGTFITFIGDAVKPNANGGIDAFGFFVGNFNYNTGTADVAGIAAFGGIGLAVEYDTKHPSDVLDNTYSMNYNDAKSKVQEYSNILFDEVYSFQKSVRKNTNYLARVFKWGTVREDFQKVFKEMAGDDWTNELWSKLDAGGAVGKNESERLINTKVDNAAGIIENTYSVTTTYYLYIPNVYLNQNKLEAFGVPAGVLSSTLVTVSLKYTETITTVRKTPIVNLININR